MPAPPTTIDGLSDLVGVERGPSAWRPVEQADIEAVTGVTGERHWAHTDPVRAQAGPFGGTVAPASLVAALLPSLVVELLGVTDAAMVLGEAMDHVRFPATLPAGSAVRARARVLEVTALPAGCAVRTAVVVDRDGGTSAVCEAKVTLRYFR